MVYHGIFLVYRVFDNELINSIKILINYLNENYFAKEISINQLLLIKSHQCEIIKFKIVFNEMKHIPNSVEFII